ncbi:acyloxyacyl hydrolase [Pararhodonellum marinum]|uniref:acyloxyacyl hydrolase n=1 Tax=Pararhodonellum marinum TaxID=2755358 RepID=UPI00188E8522|nr:acyloxyacyl hydrolase [Pararhodonellum marinum]
MKVLFILGLMVWSSVALAFQIDSTYKAKPSPKFVKYLDLSVEGGPMLGNGTDFGEQLRNSSSYLGVDARLGFRRGAESLYSRVYRYPTFGVGFYASTFHNADVGEPNAIYFFLHIPFAYSPQSRVKFSYFASYGLSYNFNPFDPEDNPLNLFIGSYRNVYAHLGFRAAYTISPKTAITSTFGFKHFSNGASSLPNSGINLFPLSIGVTTMLNDHDKDFSDRSIPKHTRRDVLHIHVAPGVKEYFVGDVKHFKLGSGIHYLREFSYKHRAGLGLEHFYSANASERADDPSQSDFLRYNSFAVFGSWEWLLTENLYAPMGVGAYLHRNDFNGEWNWFYQRVGLRYRFANNIFAGLSIKAHKGRADFFEWTLGYSIFQKGQR